MMGKLELALSQQIVESHISCSGTAAAFSGIARPDFGGLLAQAGNESGEHRVFTNFRNAIVHPVISIEEVSYTYGRDGAEAKRSSNASDYAVGNSNS